MRDVKFRAWDREEKEWFTPTQIDFDNVHEENDIKYHSCWRQRSQVSGDGMWKWCEIYMFTGWRDKNKKEIYEGDKLSSKEHNIIFDIIFYDGQFIPNPECGYIPDTFGQFEADYHTITGHIKNEKHKLS